MVEEEDSALLTEEAEKLGLDAEPEELLWEDTIEEIEDALSTEEEEEPSLDALEEEY